MKKFTRAAGVVLTASLMTAGALSTANAAAAPDVADRLDQIAQVVDPVPLKSSPVGAVSGGKVRLGDAKSSQIRLGLPASTSKPTRDDGRYLLDGSKGASLAVAPTKNGAQVLVGVESSKAPTTYAFDVDAPAGFAPVLSRDGSAAVVDADGQVAAEIEAPWAFDATGKRVPTHFRVSGDRLTQVVDHRGGDYAYPIVADPKISLCSWGRYVCVKLNKSETKKAYKLVKSGSARAGAAALCTFLGVSGGPLWALVRAGCAVAVAAAIGSIRTNLRKAIKAGYCLNLNFRIGVPPTVSPSYRKC